MYFLSKYENRKMKPVEIVLRKGEEERRMMEEENPTKIYFTYVNTSQCIPHTTIAC
jgi:hypothetical protein